MLFNSIEFLLFFPTVCLVYFVIPHKIRYIFLLIASYYFYMCWNPTYAFLLAVSTVITYLSGILIKITPPGVLRTASPKLWVALSFTLNLLILIFFKYFDFLASNLSSLLSLVNISMSVPKLDILLPVGISFYTFQALSYTMDVYRGEIEPQKNILKYALFVSFFPQLVAGPIERSKNLLHQIDERHCFNADNAKSGILLMLWGYFLKLVIADRIAVIVDQVYMNYQMYTGFYLIVATFFFAVQIYCDFYGYSAIAKGAAEVMGFRLMNNFDTPYLSTSIIEFWNRWHISLTSWFRDYLYIPLGGNRKGKLRKYLNTMIVFLVSGLWHGANWSFVVWGGLNGLFQITSSVTKKARDAIASRFKINRDCFSHKLISIVFTFILVSFTWIFFRAESLSDAFQIIRRMFIDLNPGVLFDESLYTLGLNRENVSLALISIGILLFAGILRRRNFNFISFLNKQELWFRWGFIIAALLFVLIFGYYGPEFSAASFIYFQF